MISSIWEGYLNAIVSSPTVISVPIVASQIIAPGMEIEIEGNVYSVVASSTGILTINPALTTSATNIKFRQISLRIDRKWRYL